MSNWPAYSAGTAYLTVRPQISTTWPKDIQRQLREPKNNPDAKIKVTPELGSLTTLRKDMREKLAALQSTVKVTAQLGSVTEFKRQLKEKTFTANVTPTLGSMSEFRRQLKEKGQTLPDLKLGVDLDLTRARQQIAAFRASTPDLHMNLDLDTAAAAAGMSAMIAQALALRAALNGINIPGGGGAGGVGAGASSAVGPTLALTGALGALAAVNLAPLVAQLAQAAGVLALLPAAGAAAGASLATIAIGGNGVMDAFTAAGKASTASGAAAESSARKQRDAARQVEDAERAVADARENAAWTAEDGARQIESAERQIQDAQKRSKDAQEDLTRARKDALEQIEDLNLALKGSAIDEEDALIAVERARERLANLGRDGQPVTALDVREAQNNLRSSLQRVDEVRERNADLRIETDAANRAGVEGAQQVVDAKEAVTEAAQGEIDAHENLADTQEQVARSAAQAQRQIEDALRRVADAQEAQAEALTTGAGGVDAFAEAMAKLSPNAQDFVNKTRDLGDAWTDLRMAVQDNLFADMGDAITTLATTYLPMLKTGFGGIATEINGGLLGLIRALNEEGAKSNFGAIFENTRIAVKPFIDGLTSLAGALGNFAAVGSEFLPGLASGFSDLMTRFQEWSGSEAGQDWLRSFIADSIAAFKQVIDFAVSLGRVVGALFSQTEDQGGSMMQSFTDNLNKFADWLNSPEGQEKTRVFFQDMRDTLNDILALFGAVGGAISWVADLLDRIGASDATSALSHDLQDLGEEVEIWKGYWNGFAQTVSDVWANITRWFTDGWNTAVATFEGARDRITGLVDSVVGLFDGMGQGIRGVWDGIVDNIKDAVRRLGELLTKVPTKIGPITVPGGAGARDLGAQLVGWAQQNARGGFITGPGTGTSDDILSWLSNGEFVVKASAVTQWRPLLEAINNGTLPRYARGGFVGEAGERAIAVAQGKAGRPYGYGTMDDCSGHMSDIHNALTGENVRYVTGSDFASLGYEPGYDPTGFSIGTDGGVGTGGHMAGTLFGTNVESDGSNGVQYGGGANGAMDFPMVWHLPRHLWNPPQLDDPNSESLQGLSYDNDSGQGLSYSGGNPSMSAVPSSTGSPGYASPTIAPRGTVTPVSSSAAQARGAMLRGSVDSFTGRLPDIGKQMVSGWLPYDIFNPGGMLGGLINGGKYLFDWYSNPQNLVDSAAYAAELQANPAAALSKIAGGFLGAPETSPSMQTPPVDAGQVQQQVQNMRQNAPAMAAAPATGGDTYHFNVRDVDEAFRKYAQIQAKKAAGFIGR